MISWLCFLAWIVWKWSRNWFDSWQEKLHLVHLRGAFSASPTWDPKCCFKSLRFRGIRTTTAAKRMLVRRTVGRWWRRGADTGWRGRSRVHSGSGGNGVVETVAWDDAGRICRRCCCDGSAVCHRIGIGEKGQIKIRHRKTGFSVTASQIRIEELFQFRRLELLASYVWLHVYFEIQRSIASEVAFVARIRSNIGVQ